MPSLKASHVDEDCKDFLPWLERKAGAKISTALTIGKSSFHGRGLFASEYIHSGDRILKVPFSVQLSPDNLPPEMSRLIGDAIGNEAKLALLILHEKKLGQDSEWAPYITRLPPPEDIRSPICWSDEELEMIRPSFWYQETRLQKLLINTQFLASCELTNHSHAGKEFMYAHGLIRSRAWKSDDGVPSLIPFLDFINHDSASEACVWSDSKEQHFEVTVDHDYAAGDEIRIRYGKHSNAMLLQNFGFTDFNNSRDFVAVYVKLHPEDKLYARKSDILQGQRRTAEEDNELVSRWNLFKINQVEEDGEGIPVLLRAFARIRVCDSERELDELCKAAVIDGRVGRDRLKNRVKEVAAHVFLYYEISRLIQRYDDHINNLQVPTTQLCGRASSLLRRRLAAEDLLQGELRILKSARDWLGNYCLKICKN